MCESLKDGRVLLKVLDRLNPGCVDWRRVRNAPSRLLLKRPVSIETCNQVPLPASSFAQLLVGKCKNDAHSHDQAGILACPEPQKHAECLLLMNALLLCLTASFT